MNDVDKKWEHLKKIEFLCDEPFLDFLDGHWNIIKNPEEIVELLVSNEDKIKSNDGDCGYFFSWEYDVKVRPFSFRCSYDAFNPPRDVVHTNLGDLRFNSFNEHCWGAVERMMLEINVDLKINGSWYSELKKK